MKRNSILVVDDDYFFRKLITDVLSPLGYEVLEARSANDALMMLAHKPALAIIDYRLPQIDGITLIALLKARQPDIQILYCSGTGCSQKIFTLLRNILKVTHILKKPIQPRALIDQVTSLLPLSFAIDSVNQESEEASLTDQLQALVAANLTNRSRPDSKRDFTQKAEQTLQSSEAQAPPATQDCQSIVLENDLKDTLAELSKTYLKELPTQLSQLSDGLKQIRDHSPDSDLLANTISIAHKIRGTAGSFGYILLGQMAGQIEDVLDTVDGAAPNSSERSTQLTALITSVERWSKTVKLELQLEANNLDQFDDCRDFAIGPNHQEHAISYATAL